ncbi:aspartyl/glutamyl-tRNA amidotransferase subunit A [Candidatus Parcubacteria bacterium 4484_255]|nr:MAG: aspartyl/glutamyl-tRNA amidotransferase subunit A [Candidatus Parcubacteria bacterium 4484_255]
MELNSLTIKQANQGLKKGDFSSQELTKSCIQVIKSGNPDINAFITILEKQSLEQAKEVDAKKSFKKNVLAGIPIAIKDNILVKDVLCTAGSKVLENYKAGYDAFVVKKLKQAGAILIGKTNMDEFAMGSSNETSYFGPVKNPHNLSYVPGGSSGGSAAAVASKMCLGALGSDTGGSVRQPASFCGIVGFKPSYGLVSRYGLIAAASSLDQIGLLARTVKGAKIILDAIKGHDLLDSTSVEESALPPQTNIKSLKETKIGIPKEYFENALNPKIKFILKKRIDDLAKLGAVIKNVSLPHTEYALAVYHIIMSAEISTNLARYDGIRYGFSCFKKSKYLLDVYLDSRFHGFGEEAKRRIMLGAYSLSAERKKDYYLRAQKVRSLIKRDFVKIFKSGIDCLITPTTLTPAFRLGEKIDNPLLMSLSDICTVSVNLAGLPAISLPMGKVKDLPVGLQIIGDYFQDNKILQIAGMISNSF